METKVARLQLGDGRELFFEDNVDLPVRGERLTSIDIIPDINLEKSLDTIKSAANQLIDTFASLSKQPDECELIFGIKLSAAAGAIIAKAGAEANFTVKMKWRSAPTQNRTNPDIPALSATAKS